MNPLEEQAGDAALCNAYRDAANEVDLRRAANALDGRFRTVAQIVVAGYARRDLTNRYDTSTFDDEVINRVMEEFLAHARAGGAVTASAPPAGNDATAERQADSPGRPAPLRCPVAMVKTLALCRAIDRDRELRSSTGKHGVQSPPDTTHWEKMYQQQMQAHPDLAERGPRSVEHQDAVSRREQGLKKVRMIVEECLDGIAMESDDGPRVAALLRRRIYDEEPMEQLAAEYGVSTRTLQRKFVDPRQRLEAELRRRGITGLDSIE